MKRIYNLSYRLIAYILFVGLFLQSCGGSQNQVIPQERGQLGRTLELPDNPLINTDKEIITSGGYLASFYEEDGELKADLKADENQSNPNYKGVSVIVEEGADLTSLTKLDTTTRKNRIELNRSHSGQLRHITIRKGGLSGGMMEGDGEQLDNNLNNEVIPDECFCPITQEIMEDPVTAWDGHTYEREAIKRWFDMGKRTSPKTGARLLSIELVPNYSLRSMIQDLKEQIPVLARHKLEIRNIEQAIKIREEELEEMLAQKGHLVEQEIQVRLNLEVELDNKLALIHVKEEQIKALEEQTNSFELREKLLKEELMQKEILVEQERQKRLSLEAKLQQTTAIMEGQIKALEEQVNSFLERENKVRAILQVQPYISSFSALNSQFISASTSSSSRLTSDGSQSDSLIKLLQLALSGPEDKGWIKDRKKEKEGEKEKESEKEKERLKGKEEFGAEGEKGDATYQRINQAANESKHTGLSISSSQSAVINKPETTKRESGSSQREIPNNNGDTALLLAAYNGHLDTVKWLLANGANLAEKTLIFSYPITTNSVLV